MRSINETLALLTTDRSGLSTEEVHKRLAQYGRNVLPLKKPPSLFEIFVRQFKSPLIYILAAAAALSLYLGETLDASFIGIVLLLNAVIGTFQEWKAEKGTQALQRLLKTQSTALRDGELRRIDSELLVPGDIIVLESGDRVPADLRLLHTRGLEVDESLLTGESVAVSKQGEWIAAEPQPIGDRVNLAFAATTVARGRAQGVVLATGPSTQVGRIAEAASSGEAAKTPLLIRMERLTRFIAVAVFFAGILLIAIGVFRGFGWFEMIFAAIALAVAAIPEGLPVALTVALAVTTARMVRRHVLVRRLAAVEGLGSCTLIITDKTGTLTHNELTIREVLLEGDKVVSVSGVGFIPSGELRIGDKRVSLSENPDLQRLIQNGVLNNEASLWEDENGKWCTRGDAADAAFLTLGLKASHHRELLLDKLPLINQIPFEPERRFSATFHQENGSPVVYVKGAPERVLEMCNMPEREKERWLEGATSMAMRGLRVLALADGPAPGTSPEIAPCDPGSLRLRGLVGMLDPLRADAREAVGRARQAGIITAIVTGDHPETALAIARELGIAKNADELVTGSRLELMQAEDLGQAVGKYRVFARVSPEHKLKIVRAAQVAGHFVAVTGDGVNDAPALRAANIGVAMGRGGTDVARQSADIVLTDDNYASIIDGVEEGRIAYDNIRKVVFLLASTGAAEIVLVISSVAIGLSVPLLAVQLVWLNLVTNGIQHVGLAMEPSEGDVIKRRPRRPGEPVFNRLMIQRTLLTALIVGAIGIALFAWLLDQGMFEPAARNALLLFMVLFENTHVGTARSERKSIFTLSPWRSRFLLIATISAQLVHIAAMHIPIMQRVLQIEPVDFSTWVILLALALIVTAAMELHKIYWNRKHPPEAPGLDERYQEGNTISKASVKESAA